MQNLLLVILKQTQPHHTRSMMYRALLLLHHLPYHLHLANHLQLARHLLLPNLLPLARHLHQAHHSSPLYQQRQAHQFLLPALLSVAERVTISSHQNHMTIRKLVAFLHAQHSVNLNLNVKALLIAPRSATFTPSLLLVTLILAQDHRTYFMMCLVQALHRT
jgi:hypothetical protein